MPQLEMIPDLCTIKVHLIGEMNTPPYTIELNGELFDTSHKRMEEAIAFLRERGHQRAQVVNGPEVYVLTWGPLLAPWEGEPG